MSSEQTITPIGSKRIQLLTLIPVGVVGIVMWSLLGTSPETNSTTSTEPPTSQREPSATSPNDVPSAPPVSQLSQNAPSDAPNLERASPDPVAPDSQAQVATFLSSLPRMTLVELAWGMESLAYHVARLDEATTVVNTVLEHSEQWPGTAVYDLTAQFIHTVTPSFGIEDHRTMGSLLEIVLTQRDALINTGLPDDAQAAPSFEATLAELTETLGSIEPGEAVPSQVRAMASSIVQQASFLGRNDDVLEVIERIASLDQEANGAVALDRASGLIAQAKVTESLHYQQALFQAAEGIIISHLQQSGAAHQCEQLLAEIRSFGTTSDPSTAVSVRQWLAHHPLDGLQAVMKSFKQARPNYNSGTIPDRRAVTAYLADLRAWMDGFSEYLRESQDTDNIATAIEAQQTVARLIAQAEALRIHRYNLWALNRINRAQTRCHEQLGYVNDDERTIANILVAELGAIDSRLLLPEVNFALMEVQQTYIQELSSSRDERDAMTNKGGYRLNVYYRIFSAENLTLDAF